MWFAFEIYIFDILIQQKLEPEFLFLCCDLLSKFISLIFWYNHPEINESDYLVVICFRNLYLWYSDTTDLWGVPATLLLWFAFEIYIFDILIQLSANFPPDFASCDLLSKFISLIFWYNIDICLSIFAMLWFAFEIYIFDILIQRKEFTIDDLLVVICFRNLYLWYSDTTKNRIPFNTICCDLLSKFISLIFWYNKIKKICTPLLVVICFRNLYLWYSDTTINDLIEYW